MIIKREPDPQHVNILYKKLEIKTFIANKQSYRNREIARFNAGALFSPTTPFKEKGKQKSDSGVTI